MYDVVSRECFKRKVLELHEGGEECLLSRAGTLSLYYLFLTKHTKYGLH